uniref:Uncharacterized protein n=1 Tax=Tetranychus urticae TaxID=32264 RepID=T1K2B9_TETUR
MFHKSITLIIVLIFIGASVCLASRKYREGLILGYLMGSQSGNHHQHTIPYPIYLPHMGYSSCHGYH